MAIATVRPTATASPELTVVRGRIIMPRTGAWHASLWVDAQTKFSGRVQITAGELTLLGTVNRATVYRGQLRLRIVAGGDGLRKEARPKHYTSPVMRLPLAELARDAGEAISPTSDPGTMSTTLLSWTTLGMETGAMISTLVSLSPKDGVLWRMLADGTIWVGADTWPDSKITDFRLLEESPEDAAVTYGMALPSLVPGTTIGGRRADLVEHVLEPDEYRVKVWTSAG